VTLQEQAGQLFSALDVETKVFLGNADSPALGSACHSFIPGTPPALPSKPVPKGAVCMAVFSLKDRNPDPDLPLQCGPSTLASWPMLLENTRSNVSTFL
jgi:hypothetical protein